jgi:hypothetical protein
MTFLLDFAYVLPGVIIGWAVAYLVLIKRKKHRVGGSLALMSLLGVAVIMALLKEHGFEDVLVTSMIFSFIACALLRSLYPKQEDATKSTVATDTEGS